MDATRAEAGAQGAPPRSTSPEPTPPAPVNPRRWRWTILTLAAASGAFLLRGSWSRLSGALPPCEVRRLTGLHCPGCGGTRCTGHLLEGNLPAAVGMNALVVVLAAVASALLLTAVLRERTGRIPAFPLLPGWSAWILGGLVLVFALTRNLPWWPFTLLVPH